MESTRYVVGLVLCAFVMGGVFDIYNTVTGSTRWLRWVRPVLDVLCWFLFACLVYYTAFVTNDGQLRVYTLVLLAIGYGLYRLWLHRLVVNGAHGVVRVVRALTMLLLRILNVLVIQPLSLLFRLFFVCLSGLYRVGCLVESGLFRIVAIPWRIIAWSGRRWLPRAALLWQRKMLTRWEDFWVWLSNRIIGPPKGPESSV